MKHLLISIVLLGSIASTRYAQAQPIITQAIEAGQQHRQHSDTQLVATNRIYAQATGVYSAAQSISLQPGFVAQAGSVFSASIRSEQQLNRDVSNQLSLQAYPNPFGPTTRIAYKLPYGSQVRGLLTTIQGLTVGSEQPDLVWQEAGWHELSLSGAGLPSGTYIFRLQIGTQQKAIRLIRQP